MNFCRFYNNTMKKLDKVYFKYVERKAYNQLDRWDRFNEVERVNVFIGILEMIVHFLYLVILFLTYVPVRWLFGKLYDLTSSELERKIENKKL